MKKLSQKQILMLHKQLIQQTGGSDGVRDYNLLDAALEAPFQTFDNKDFSEEPYIDFVNHRLGLETTKLTFLSKDFIKYWSKSTWFFEAPMNHEGTLALCNLNEEASKDVTVMLCGDGPDESLGGILEHMICR